MPTYNQVVLEDTARIPSDVYVLRITSCEKKTSRKGNLMLATTAEIVYPHTVKFAGEEIPVAGRQTAPWYNLLDPTVPWGVGRIVSALKRAGLLEKLALPPGVSFDDEKVGLLIGCMYRGLVQCEDRYLQRETQDGGYEPVLDDNGNLIRVGTQLLTDWSSVVGKAPSDLNEAPF